MEKGIIQVLLILSGEDNSLFLLKELFGTVGYAVTQAASLNAAIRVITEIKSDLIICQQELSGVSGFRIYENLRPTLSRWNIPFFLLLENFQKEDILVGLEMGIDNFIFCPIDKMSVLNKTERQLEKGNRAFMMRSDHYRSVFNISPTARFIMKNEQIAKINKAFSRLTGIVEPFENHTYFKDLFILEEGGVNKLDYYRCMNGLIPCCLLRSVPFRLNSNQVFDIQIVCNNPVGENSSIVEVIPVAPYQLRGGEMPETGAGASHSGANKMRELLTLREEEILILSAKGLPIKQIAHRLQISDRTVEKHRANIMQKTKSTSIIEAIYYLQLNTV